MKDGIVKGTGNSRYLKGSGWPESYEEFKAMAEAGTLPFDLNGINAAGWQQIGTALNKGALLKDTTAAAYNLNATALPDDVLEKASKAAIVTESTVDYAFETIVCPVTPQTVYFFCPGDGKMIAGGNAGNILYTENGVNWSSYAFTDLEDYNEMNMAAYGNGMFIGLPGGKNNKLYYSVDGKSWRNTALPASAYWSNIVYGNGLFVIYGSVGSSTYLYTSEDGFTWTYTTTFTSGGICDMAYGAGKFVLVGVAGLLYYSDDGLTWTKGEMPIKTISWNSISYGNGRFVAIGSTSEYVGSAAYSDDGIHWMASKLPDFSVRWSQIGYGDGQFFARAPGVQNFAFSRDGIHWVGRANGLPDDARNNSIFAYGRFYFAGCNGNIKTAKPVKSNVLTDYFENILQYYIPGTTRITVGSYVGTGTDFVVLNFVFPPKLVMCSRDGFIKLYFYNGRAALDECFVWYQGVEKSEITSSIATAYLNFSLSGSSLSWHSPSNAKASMNLQSSIYYYIAIG